MNIYLCRFWFHQLSSQIYLFKEKKPFCMQKEQAQNPVKATNGNDCEFFKNILQQASLRVNV